MSIMSSMVQNNILKGMINNMGEKIYKTMKHSGAGAIVLGVLCVIFGITVGVISIVNGAKLIKGKNYISF